MKLSITIVILAIVVWEAQSASLGSLVNAVGSAAAKILNYQNENNGADGYKFSYETEDGSKRQEEGGFVNGIWTVKGFFEWIDPQGKKHETEYMADDKGYMANERGGLSAGALASLAG